MLGKLIKYDLLFGVKRYGALFMLLCGTWLSGLLVSMIGNTYLNGMFMWMNILMSIFFIGAYIITSLQFFYQSLSGEESYFNYTIPVGTVSLIFSKLAAIWIWGAALTGALTLTWVSLHHTLLIKMGLDLIDMFDGMLGFLISVVIAQFILQSCLLAYSVSIFNTPKLKTTNSGIVLVAVVAYLLMQAVGVLMIGLFALVQYIADPEIFEAIIKNTLSPGQEASFIQTMQWVLVGAAVVLSPVFFGLTVRTVEKRRSI